MEIALSPLSQRSEEPAPGAATTPALRGEGSLGRRGGPETTLADLGRRAAAGDELAFRELHDRLTPGLRELFGTAARGRREVVEDLTQRTWVGVWRSLSTGGYDPERAAISTFVYAVAHKVRLQHLRGLGQDRPGGGGLEAGDVEAGGVGPSTDMEFAETLEVVRAAMRGEAAPGADALDAEERAVLRAAAAGESDRALAERLGLAPSTANARKRAALEKLRRFLAKRGHRGERGADGREQP